MRNVIAIARRSRRLHLNRKNLPQVLRSLCGSSLPAPQDIVGFGRDVAASDRGIHTPNPFKEPIFGNHMVFDWKSKHYPSKKEIN